MHHTFHTQELLFFLKHIKTREGHLRRNLLTCHYQNQEKQRCFHRDIHLFLPSRLENSQLETIFRRGGGGGLRARGSTLLTTAVSSSRRWRMEAAACRGAQTDTWAKTWRQGFLFSARAHRLLRGSWSWSWWCWDCAQRKETPTTAEQSPPPPP